MHFTVMFRRNCLQMYYFPQRARRPAPQLRLVAS